MALDRRIAPPIQTIERIVIPHVDFFTLPNGVKVVMLNQGSQEILKFEIFYKAGRSTESKRLVSRAMASLLKEGTASFDSQKIASQIDFYGASIKTASNMDFVYLSLHTLTKYFGNIAPIVSEMVHSPKFDEDEIVKFSNLNIERLREELTKNEVIAYRTLTESIFGTDHAYGYNSEVSDYKNLRKDDLVHHWNTTIGSDNCTIFVSGYITEDVINTLSKYFGQSKSQTSLIPYRPSTIALNHQKIFSYTTNEHQSSLKIGRKLFDKSHPDNASAFLLNTILGGYFGSRLMTSIREEKGFTYDINSSIDQMLYDGYFSISSEAAPKYIEPMLEHIYHEIELLQTEEVPNEELSMVKNYLMGNFMNLLDGPLNAMSFIKTMVLTEQKLEDFHTFVDEINATDSNRINSLANIYLQREDIIEVIIGPKSK
jgi:zinc protease